MHVHPSPINPNAQLDALYAAEKTAAKREAERTRKKLLESASALAGHASGEACVVKLRARGESQKQASQQQAQGKKKQKEQSNAGDAADVRFNSISDWA
jgi:hypothetical protein